MSSLIESTSAGGSDDLLRVIVEGTATAVGEAFFQTLVRHLAAAMNVRYAFVAEFLGNSRARTLAYWRSGTIAPNFEWDLRGTPCEEVVAGGLCHHENATRAKFPNDAALSRLAIEGFLGVPLCDPAGNTLGHLAVFDDQPMPAAREREAVFRIFAARAAAELMRLRMERMLHESEERLRDLFDESPIAYVQEGLDTRFIRANRAALRALGITADEVEGTYGRTFVVDNPENQRRMREAFESVSRGVDTGGIVLELRRRDDGKPLWIQWWSRPDPSGQYTRTMFIDITEKVLLEKERARLSEQNVYLQEEIKAAHNFEEIVGRSKPLLNVLENVRRVAITDSTVLITGETGCGKELIARAIHSSSKRREKPLIKVNCAALPTGLVESELFGHEKGAFSGAIARRIGRFELAAGGTIFLDEIGEMPPDVQVKLLRVLQEREFERVGGGAVIRADVRVIAATNRDLPAEVKAGKFREDLYYRLSVFPVHLPPLRERVDDIPLLVEFLIRKHAMRIGKRVEGVTAESMRRLIGYRWPGNVRELENVIERAVILTTLEWIEIDPVVNKAEPRAVVAGAAPGAATLEELERQHVIDALTRTRWVIEGDRGAAKILGLHPNTLRSRLKRLGLSRPTHENS